MSAEKIFKYGEFEGTVDLSDYVFVEKWEAALADHEATRKAIAETAKGKNNAAQLKGLVLAIAAFFDTALGDGASNQILGATTSFDAAHDAFKALIAFSKTQSAEMQQRWKQTVADFSPQNRAQRRAQGK